MAISQSESSEERSYTVSVLRVIVVLSSYGLLYVITGATATVLRVHRYIVTADRISPVLKKRSFETTGEWFLDVHTS